MMTGDVSNGKLSVETMSTQLLRPRVCKVVLLCVIVLSVVLYGVTTVDKRPGTRPEVKQLSQHNGLGGVNLGQIQQGNLCRNNSENDLYKRWQLIQRVRLCDSKSNKNKQVTPQRRVVFNRVPKCGSRTVINITVQLARRNGFNFYGTEKNNVQRWSPKGQRELANLISSLEAPFIYNHHLHFINFTRFGFREPLYFNIIREPIDRYISDYYFSRYGDSRVNGYFKGSEKERNMTINECVLSNHTECQTKQLHTIIPYFCGQHERCRNPSNWALEKAISNVDEKYLVVGFLEELEDTLRILEMLLPDMFDGAPEVLKLISINSGVVSRTTTKNKVLPTEEVRKILKQRMVNEYRFYEAVKERFSDLKTKLNIRPVKKSNDSYAH